MKRFILTLILLIISFTCMSQRLRVEGMTLIEYDERYDTIIQKRISEEKVQDLFLQERRRQGQYNIFVRGNFNQINIIRRLNVLDDVPQNCDNNNAEYHKLNSFNPNKTLEEILKDDKL